MYIYLDDSYRLFCCLSCFKTYVLLFWGGFSLGVTSCCGDCPEVDLLAVSGQEFRHGDGCDHRTGDTDLCDGEYLIYLTGALKWHPSSTDWSLSAVCMGGRRGRWYELVNYAVPQVHGLTTSLSLSGPTSSTSVSSSLIPEIFMAWFLLCFGHQKTSLKPRLCSLKGDLLNLSHSAGSTTPLKPKAEEGRKAPGIWLALTLLKITGWVLLYQIL